MYMSEMELLVFISDKNELEAAQHFFEQAAQQNLVSKFGLSFHTVWFSFFILFCWRELWLFSVMISLDYSFLSSLNS